MLFCTENAELPDIIFEILSPSTMRTDLIIKLSKYEEMGIKEYWIIDPKTQTVVVHDFVNQKAESYGINDTITSSAYKEIIIQVKDLFQ